MSFVCNQNMCSGCMACVNICNKNAITIIDNIDAYNAKINEDICINCGACYRVCPQNKEISFYVPIFWKQGWTSKTTRDSSSSGGVGAALIKSFLETDAVVCTCRFLNGKFVYDFVNSIDEIQNYIGSKYVKSSPENVYVKIKKYLNDGKKVLFIGLPCHVAAVKLYCGEILLENLYTVDLICHGTPSPKLLETFLEEYNISFSEVEDIKFRKKTHFHLYIKDKLSLPDRVMDMYTFAFLEGLTYTENCYSCKFAKLERVSDITIGDSWGTNLHHEEPNGISLVLCQTEKGKKLVNELDMHWEFVDLQNAINANHQLSHPSCEPTKRNKFMKLIKRGIPYKNAIAKCYPIVYAKQKIKKILIDWNILQN